MNSLQIIYEDGSTQVINPTVQFDGRYDLLAAHIAEGRAHTYKILK
jgi:hypothetical protein